MYQANTQEKSWSINGKTRMLKSRQSSNGEGRRGK